jgi:phospholipid transport system transporter-binding protein
MADFELTDRGGGEFGLAGELTFATATAVLKATTPLFSEGANLRFDLADISRADSAGVALLIEWLRWAERADASVRFTHLPDALRAIIRVSGVQALLTFDATGTSI